MCPSEERAFQWGGWQVRMAYSGRELGLPRHRRVQRSHGRERDCYDLWRKGLGMAAELQLRGEQSGNVSGVTQVKEPLEILSCHFYSGFVQKNHN